MNKNYTLEDIEALRAKAGITYEEAVTLLDKYDGDISRALVELEKRGVLGAKGHHGSDGFVDWVTRIWSLGLRTRIHITRGTTTFVNLSVLYMLLVLIFAPHVAIVSFIVALLLGCRVSFLKNSDIYESTDIHKMVNEAAENIRQGVQNFRSGEGKEETAEDKQAQAPFEDEPAPEADYDRVTIDK